MDDSQDLVLFGGVITQTCGLVAFPCGAVPLAGSHVAPVGCCYRFRNDVLTRLEGGFAIVGGELTLGNINVALVDETLARLGCPFVLGQVQRDPRSSAGLCRGVLHPADATASRFHVAHDLTSQM